MEFSKAQRRVIERAERAFSTPYEKRNAATFRFDGRGMRRTLEALSREGILTFEEDFNTYTCSSTYYVISYIGNRRGK